MFYTSAMTSILPYILFLGIMCTYYLGIVNEAFISEENRQTFSTKKVFLLEEAKTTFEKDYYINSGKVDFDTEKLHFSDINSFTEIVFPEKIKSRTEAIYKYLFIRPPPYFSIL